MFDDFSSTFEEKLIDSLEYTAPRDVAEAAAKRIQDEENSDGRRGRLYSSAIDAGCGTGLIGPHLREIVDGPIVGVDLSPKMAELAAELVVDSGPTPMAKNRMRRCDEMARTAQGIKRLYDGVFTGDLLNLNNAKSVDGYGHDVRTFPVKPVDLIVCADVLCYFGDVREVLQEFSDRLAVGGDLVFTTETMAQGDYNWVMLVSERYAHSPEYVNRMAAEAGLSKVSQVAFTPRMELGEKVLGTLHTFTKR
jgi:predicted TPR repeat methyltransferase